MVRQKILLSGLLMLLSFTFAIPQEIRISPARKNVMIGDAFSINIEVADITNLAGFQYDISYDPDILGYVTSEKGSFLSNRGQNELFCMDADTKTLGLIHNLVCVTLGGGSVNGTGVINTITFAAIKSGKSDIKLLNVKLVDPHSNYLPYKTINGIACVSPSVTVANPTSSITWVKGQSASIAWISCGINGNISIYLYKGSSMMRTIALNTLDTGAMAWTVPKTGLSDGIDYFVRVEDAANSSVYGVSPPFAIKANVVLNPPSLRAPTNGSTDQPASIALRWQDTNEGPQEKAYQIRIKKAGGAYALINAAQNAVTYQKNGLSSNSKYFWNLRAIGNGASIKNSAWANSGLDWSFIVAPPVVLDPPILSSPSNGSTGQLTDITIQWIDTNSTHQELGYQIRIKPQGGSYSNINTASDIESYLKKGLIRNKTYFWNVRAKGNGASLKDSNWANSGVDWIFTTLK